MKLEDRNLHLVQPVGKVIVFEPKPSDSPTEVAHLRSMLRCSTFDLAEHRRKLIALQKDLQRLRRKSFQVIQNEVPSDTPPIKR